MSWYPLNEKLSDKQLIYLSMIEQVFRVKHADKQWKHCELEPHQIEFHSNDIAVLGDKAVSDVVEKSRNTSFTTSAAIRLLAGNYKYRDEVVPLVRINEQKVKELIAEIKSIIKHMTPIRLKNGDLWPFDPAKVDMNNVMEIRFTDRDIIFRGYQASTSSAENIRGLRITRGIIDESNFMAAFHTLYIAMRDAAAGTSKAGLKHFQLTIGSTLKGMTTRFKLWLDKMKILKLPIIRILSWPVFDPLIFDIEKSIMEQPDLIPIVHWHNLQDLEYKRIEDINTFLEEYMAVCVPSDSRFYDMGKILDCEDENLINLITPMNKEEEIYIGVDPAGEGIDFFTISIFAHFYIDTELERAEQRALFYEQKSDLDKMQSKLDGIIQLWNPVKVRIDGNALGYQMSQYFKNKYPSVVEIFRGRMSIKQGKFSVSINEFLHTNQKKLFTFNRIKLFNDDLQLNHYGSWNYNFTCESTKEYGHGDSTISNGLALLPFNWKIGDRKGKIVTNMKEEEIYSTESIKQKVQSYNRSPLIDRIKRMKKLKNMKVR